jgi:hypothetical protein
MMVKTTEMNVFVLVKEPAKNTQMESVQTLTHLNVNIVSELSPNNVVMMEGLMIITVS